MKAELMKFIQKYAPVTDEQASVLADYALATWKPLPSEVKYLHITGGPETGKTILGKVMGAVCKNPLFWTAGFSPSAFLDILENSHPCTAILEIDPFPLGAHGKRLLQILVSGLNSDTSVILAYVKKELVSFRTFGYKILIGGQLSSNYPLIISRFIAVRLGVGMMPAEINFIDPNTFMDHFRADAEALQFALQEEFGALA